MRMGRDRVAWLSGLLGFAQPGLGHLYAGRLRRGAVLYLLVELVFIAAFTIPIALPQPRLAFIAAVTMILAARLFAARDAARAARQAEKPYRLRWYNRWFGWLPLLLLLAFFDPAILIVPRMIGLYTVTTPSMQPTLVPGDRVFVNKMAYWRRDPKRGDVVAYAPPQYPGVIYAHRVVGLPGERIDFKADDVLINGIRLREEYAYFGGPDQVPFPLPTITLSPFQFFMLGDNRHNSGDSRFSGPVRRDALVGRVESIYWSRDRGGAIRWERTGRRVER